MLNFHDIHTKQDIINLNRVITLDVRSKFQVISRQDHRIRARQHNYYIYRAHMCEKPFKVQKNRAFIAFFTLFHVKHSRKTVFNTI